MAKVIRAIVLLGLFLNTYGREILSYVDGSTMRREEGTPGRKVTGEWAWTDLDGKEHKISYVADTNGFRAFGNLIPEDWTSQDFKIPTIGSSVVSPIAVEGDDSDAKDLMTSMILGSTAGKHKSEEVQEEPEEPKQRKPLLESTTGNHVSHSGVESVINSTVGLDWKDSFVAGTSFTLLSKRLPTSFSSTMATEEAKIKPIPVKNGSPLTVVTGILTAPRAKTVFSNSRKAKTFNEIPVRTPPKPFKIEGMVNLDNFLRPAVSNSDPNQREGNLEDYLYYDDYYYDDNLTTSTPSAGIKNETVGRSSPSPPSTTTKKPKEKVRRIRSEESEESSESEESG